MRIYNREGDLLFKSEDTTMRETVEKALKKGIDLRRANLLGADLRRAKLLGADLEEANLRGANLPGFQIVPEEGSFTAWKIGSDNILIKIEVCEDAKRTSSLIGRKCRASKVRVLQAWDKDGKELEQGTRIQNWNTNYPFIYVVGGIAETEYDDDIRVECTQGIHFFMTRREAEEWR